MIACEPCALDWPELDMGFGGLVMKERCRMAFAATGFRLGPEATLKAQLWSIKYGGDRRKAKRWGAWLGENTFRPVHPDRRLVLAPVPLHWRKKWKRGYNQAEWIARGLAQVWQCEVASNALHRLRHHTSMTGMSRMDRAGVVRDLYHFNPTCRIAEATFLVVDDVLTTGATMAACGGAIKRSGVNWLGGITLALA